MLKKPLVGTGSKYKKNQMVLSMIIFDVQACKWVHTMPYMLRVIKYLASLFHTW